MDIKTLKFITKTDIYLLAGLICLAGLVCFAMPVHAGKVYAEVFVSGEKITTLDLSKEQRCDVGGVRILIKDYAVCVAESACKDKICVRTGYVSRPGRMIICAPNRIAVKITALYANTIDAVAG